MASGGPRNRSGPPVEPDSGRSRRRAISLDALPPDGFTGVAPEFPLPQVSITWDSIAGPKVLVEETAQFRARELALWTELWKSPQAAAWSLPENEFRHRIVASYCRLSVRCEAANASASLIGQLHRFADQIGMTTAGMRENGWTIKKTDDPAAGAQASGGAAGAKGATAKPRARARSRGGLSLVATSGGA